MKYRYVTETLQDADNPDFSPIGIGHWEVFDKNGRKGYGKSVDDAVVDYLQRWSDNSVLDYMRKWRVP